MVQVQVHLPDVVVLHVAQFQVDQHEAAQDAVVENQVHPVVAVVDGDPMLPAHEGEALAQFQQNGLQGAAPGPWPGC